MTKIKTFSDLPEIIDFEINQWMTDHPEATLLYPPSTVLGIGGRIIITIVYNE